ncbi:MAG: WxcM-like domain-containing protein [Nanoarchaeota archaeon]
MVITPGNLKKIPTKDLDGKDNGGLFELFKEGAKTTAYMITLPAGAYKGYHWHRVRWGRYICVRGKIKVITYTEGKREEHILDSAVHNNLVIPVQVANKILNIGEEEAWLINFPEPPYDPEMKDEQIDYTEEELEAGIRK